MAKNVNLGTVQGSKVLSVSGVLMFAENGKTYNSLFGKVNFKEKQQNKPAQKRNNPKTIKQPVSKNNLDVKIEDTMQVKPVKNLKKEPIKPVITEIVRPVEKTPVTPKKIIKVDKLDKVEEIKAPISDEALFEQTMAFSGGVKKV